MEGSRTPFGLTHSLILMVEAGKRSTIGSKPIGTTAAAIVSDLFPRLVSRRTRKRHDENCSVTAAWESAMRIDSRRAASGHAPSWADGAPSGDSGSIHHQVTVDEYVDVTCFCSIVVFQPQQAGAAPKALHPQNTPSSNTRGLVFHLLTIFQATRNRPRLAQF